MFFSKAGGVSWLVVFLGNPGLKYEGTRHNAGFMAADAMAKKLGVSINRSRFKALTGVCSIGDQSVMLMKPQTYMNLSGNAIAEARRFYKLDPAHILVLSDDISLPVGRIRVRAEGSAGGHNGLKSIIAQLGSQAFPRVRIGVGEKPHPDADLADHVLSGFSAEERTVMAESYRRSAEAALEVIRGGLEAAAREYNRK